MGKGAQNYCIRIPVYILPKEQLEYIYTEYYYSDFFWK
jgi:hypothetical protein